jgi:hypothetical protein
MKRLFLLPTLLLVAAAPANAGEIRGQYVEARTCDVYTGACFANADTGLAGKNAVLAWKIESGTVGTTQLDGLGVVAVVAASESLGFKTSTAGRAILIVDEKATSAQRSALIDFVKAQAGDLVKEVVAVHAAPVELTICNCDGNGCAIVKAGEARVATRCIDTLHDKGCGNETEYYPPLINGVSAKAAMTTEHSFTGKGLNETWSDADRRGAYVGSFLSR